MEESREKGITQKNGTQLKETDELIDKTKNSKELNSFKIL